MGRYDGKVVFITGASSGIGAALAREVASQGADLALLARRTDRLDVLKREIEALGRRAFVSACDVTREGDLEASTRDVLKEFGKIDVVVANAGFGVAGDFESLQVEDYQRQFETNIFGVLRTGYATLDALKASRGTLVLIGSVAGYITLAGSSPYGMSKSAIHAFAQAFRRECRPHGISVVLIVPGFVDSEIRQVDNLGAHVAAAPDPIPAWIRMSTAKAARQISAAIAHRRSEKVITGHGKLAVFFQRHFPGLIDWISTFGLRGRGEPKN